MLLDNKNKCLQPNPQLIFDEACLDIINHRDVDVTVYGQYAECEKCSYQNLTTLSANESTSLLVNTKYSFSTYYAINDTLICR